MGTVLSVNISERRGTVKHPVPEIRLEVGVGIAGDAHAGSWHRQVSLLAAESVDTMRGCGLELRDGDFAENVNTRGIDLKSLPVGTRLAAGSAVLEVTQIGKECHSDCEIRRRTGRCVMPTEGIFARVVRSGTVRPGDTIEVLEAQP